VNFKNILRKGIHEKEIYTYYHRGLLDDCHSITRFKRVQ
jgi:hypothetical protein